MNYKHLINSAKEAAVLAGGAIVEIYESGDFSVEAKADNSPLTVADKAAHKVIMENLEATGLPILSEEGRMTDYVVRSQWEYFWLVDPLDGTKEFIKKNGEFTVNIALVHRQKAIAGVVYCPVLKWLYWSIPDEGAFKQEEFGIQRRIFYSKNDESDSTRVVASRSHMNETTSNYIGQLGASRLISMGSSLKLLLVAEGSADIYPRFAPTMEWDTAAAHGIAVEAGVQVYQGTSAIPLQYNKPDLLNPHFIVKPVNK